MDAERRELRNAAIFIRDHIIEQVIPQNSHNLELDSELLDSADEVLDLQGHYIVLPGLVNTHHHFFQTLTRVVPAAQNCSLFQ